MTKDEAEARALVVLNKYIRGSSHILTGSEGPGAAFDYMQTILIDEFMKLTPEKPTGESGE